MSSKVVHDKIMTYLTANWTTTPIFDFDNYLRDADLPLTPWIGIQFMASREGVVSLTGTSTTGYREIGIFFIHAIIPNGFDMVSAVTMCEDLRNLFRGKRIDDTIVIIKANPPTQDNGIALNIKGNWVGWAVVIEYYSDFFY